MDACSSAPAGFCSVQVSDGTAIEVPKASVITAGRHRWGAVTRAEVHWRPSATMPFQVSLSGGKGLVLEEGFGRAVARGVGVLLRVTKARPEFGRLDIVVQGDGNIRGSSSSAILVLASVALIRGHAIIRPDLLVTGRLPADWHRGLNQFPTHKAAYAGVGGIALKCEAARSAGLKLVVPKVNEAELQGCVAGQTANSLNEVYRLLTGKSLRPADK